MLPIRKFQGSVYNFQSVLFVFAREWPGRPVSCAVSDSDWHFYLRTWELILQEFAKLWKIRSVKWLCSRYSTVDIERIKQFSSLVSLAKLELDLFLSKTLKKRQEYSLSVCQSLHVLSSRAARWSLININELSRSPRQKNLKPWLSRYPLSTAGWN